MESRDLKSWEEVKDVDDVRSRLAVALDTDDLVVALRWARGVAGSFGVAKVGLELYSAEGPEAVEALIEEGFEVFVDLKLHDIPTTVGRAARVLGGLGARYVTVHASGGEEMVRAAVEGLAAGAEAAGLAAPVALGVTVLTSDSRHSAALVEERLAVAVAAGCRGVVCSADDLATIAGWMDGSSGRIGADDVAARSTLVTVVPGIRPAGTPAGDQRRVATPGDALAAGASLLVVGRPVTASGDPVTAARSIAGEVATALTDARGQA